LINNKKFANLFSLDSLSRNFKFIYSIFMKVVVQESKGIVTPRQVEN
jgi:hypothetical protein